MRDLLRSTLVFSVSILLVVPHVSHRAHAADDRSAATDACTGPGATPTWAVSTMHGGLGYGSIVVDEDRGVPEIYIAANYGQYWVALRYDGASGTYVHRFVSTDFGGFVFDPAIVKIRVGDVAGDADDEIVVALGDGRIVLYDQSSKAQVGAFATVDGLATVELGDLDGDGTDEIVVAHSGALRVYSGSGDLLWSLSGPGGSDVAIAQLDADPALEIACVAGGVVDSGTHEVQWVPPAGGPVEVETADTDGDGLAELFVWGSIQTVRAYDVDLQLEKWALPVDASNGALLLADVDGDTLPETLVGEAQDHVIIAYDSVTRAVEGIQQLGTERGITDLAVGDVDGDGAVDLLWNTGYSDTGPDHVWVADWPTKQIAWKSDDLLGPMQGPEIGDVDGDGEPELVVSSRYAESGHRRGRILVFDARTRRLRASTPPGVHGETAFEVHTVRLRDVDGDGDDEILTGMGNPYRGIVHVYDFGESGSLDLVWESPDESIFSGVYALDVVDVDSDGALELVCAGAFNLYVYDYETRGLEWVSLNLRSYFNDGLEIADLDLDGALEMAVQGRDGDVYVFDGPTKELEAVLFGPTSALALDTRVSPPALAVGTPEGEIVTYAFTTTPNPYPYVETARIAPSTERIDGVTYGATGRTWVGSGGRLREVDATGACVWASESYGAGFGRRVAPLDGTEGFFTAGPYAVVGFGTPAAGASATVGVYHAGSGTYFLRNANAPGPADVAFGFGPVGLGWRALAGNWDGVGGASVGLYDASTGFFFLRQANASGGADAVFGYGPGGAGWEPVVGDWDGDGDETVGLYDAATGFFYLRNENASGGADQVYGFGPGGAGWRPVAGDWDGDGVETVGLYDAAAGYFYLRNEHGGGGADVVFGFGPAGAGWEPVVGDWDGDGVETVGLYAGATGSYFLRNANAPGGADVVFSYGPAGAVPLAADWDGF
jgi:hypothetical protein